jgi:histo-blood group ABO system transferase
MKTALLVIATGEKYRPYIEPLLESAEKYFVKHEVVLWTDVPKLSLTPHTFPTCPRGFPGETLYRYHTFLSDAALLRSFDQLFYTDVDMRFVAPVGEEIFSDGLTATLHPGYVGTRGTPETRVESAAFTPNSTAYYCGGFQGGSTRAYIRAMQVMSSGITLDAAQGITAVWHDESHWNSYLSNFILPTKVLDPSYCYPENAGPHYTDKWRAAGLNVTPKILALEKKR